MSKVLITGITGQDGSYLAELYLSLNWEVHGLVRRSSNIMRPRIDHLFDPSNSSNGQKLHLHYGDMSDTTSLIRLISQIEPQVIINLAAQSHVAVSFEVPGDTSQVSGFGAAALFEAVRIVNPKIKIYQAGSSEMYGGMLGRDRLNEESKFDPKSPYAASKVFAHQMAKIYRDSYAMHITNGILFNHESPRRGENFVSRKITLAASRIACGQQKKLFLGNLSAKRDWGHAQEYVRAIKLMMDSDQPNDYVVATGEFHSVEDFARLAFNELGLNYEKYVEIDQALFRPNEVEDLLGDATKIFNSLGWKHETTFEYLVSDMIKSDSELIAKRKLA